MAKHIRIDDIDQMNEIARQASISHLAGIAKYDNIGHIIIDKFSIYFIKEFSHYTIRHQEHNGVEANILNKKFNSYLGPAITYGFGGFRHYKDGVLHRESGPAIRYTDRVRDEWYKDGKLHCDYGPAILNRHVGRPISYEWWIDGIEMTEREFLEWRLQNLKNEE